MPDSLSSAPPFLSRHKYLAAFNPLTIEWIYGNFYRPIRNSSNPLHSSIEACDWRVGLLPSYGYRRQAAPRQQEGSVLDEPPSGMDLLRLDRDHGLGLPGREALLTDFKWINERRRPE